MSLSGIRDVAIIFLALESLIVGGLLIVLILQVRNLIRLLKDEVTPILNEARETVTTVKGTTHFVRDTVVTPIIQAASILSAVREGVSVLWPAHRQYEQGNGNRSSDNVTNEGGL